jgi:class 3 adenylate cyclase/CHASE2 domain-containing sensor protein
LFLLVLMSWKNIKLVPCFLALGVILVVSFIQSLRFWTDGDGQFERREWVTFDWRARAAMKENPPVATNMAFLAITDKTIQAIKDQSVNLGEPYGLYWPRHIYGRVIRELKKQGAAGIGIDILFPDRRDDLAPMRFPDGTAMPSDEFFADEILKSSNVVIASTPNLIADPLFRNSAVRVGDITSQADADGVLRKARPFNELRVWNENIVQQVKNSLGLHLDTAEVRPNAIIFRDNTTNTYWLKLDDESRFDLIKMTEDILADTDYVESIPETNRWQVPFADFRAWHMGICMASIALGLDLDSAKVEPGKVVIPGTNGIDRTIPIDHRGFMYVDWSIPGNSDVLLNDALEWQILNDTDRERGESPPAEEMFKFKDRLVFIGSAATGSELTDRGATPLGVESFLISKHWNIANELIMNRFVVRSSFGAELAIVIVLGLLTALASWLLRPPWSTLVVIAVGGIYAWYAFTLYTKTRIWIPLFVPVVGAILWNHAMVVAYQLVFEGQERRRIKGVFSKLVSPNVVNELLGQKDIHLGGQRRRITVFFSDVRGFTTMTDEMQKYADEYIAKHGLEGEEAEAFRDEVATETLETVNTYLAAIADQIKKHNGTLDKYIGDCVMAFWGAPTENEAHAVSCVRSTIDAQLAMYKLNVERASVNATIEFENERRSERGEAPKPLKRLLVMGSGVNTGTAIVGLMGSEDHIFNFTVFGREVNLAARLEHVSGRSRIIVGEATYRDLEIHDPELAQTCIEQPSVQVKGIEGDVRNWEVPWRIYLADEMNAGRLDPLADPEVAMARMEEERERKRTFPEEPENIPESTGVPVVPETSPGEIIARKEEKPDSENTSAPVTAEKPAKEPECNPDDSGLELEKLKARVAAQVSATVTLRRESGHTIIETRDQPAEIEDDAPAEDFKAKKEEAVKLTAFLARKQFERNTRKGSDSAVVGDDATPGEEAPAEGESDEIK